MLVVVKVAVVKVVVKVVLVNVVAMKAAVVKVVVKVVDSKGYRCGKQTCPVHMYHGTLVLSSGPCAV